MSRLEYRKDNVLLVFKLGMTSNKKVSNTNGMILQHYSFSQAQFEHIKNGGGYKGFFELDAANCMGCALSTSENNRGGTCYTKKWAQARGFIAMMRSIVAKFGEWENIPEITDETPTPEILLDNAAHKFVRWGSYGETVLIPLQWMKDVCKVAKKWSGYTHQ